MAQPDRGEASAASQSAECQSSPKTQKSNSRNVLASPLGEEGHEVAKGVQANWIHRGAPRPANPVRRHPAKSVCTRVRMIMTLDMDVTAERRHYNTHCPPKGETTHYILRVAPLRGPPIGGQENDRVSYLCSAPYTLLPLRGISPQGETRDMERKTGKSYTSCTIPVFPPLVAGATTLPGGKHVI